MRDVTLELRVLPRVFNSLIELNGCIALVVLASVCGTRIVHDIENVVAGRSIHIGVSLVSSVLLGCSIWSLPVLFRMICRYPMLLCARIEVRANLLTMYSRSGRELARIENVCAEIRGEVRPNAVWFRVADESREHVDVPLWLLEPV